MKMKKKKGGRTGIMAEALNEEEHYERSIPPLCYGGD